MLLFGDMADVFLSYSREDQAIARRFADALQRAGISVWWDQSLRSGEAFDRVTEKALAEAAAVVVLWSKTSVESRWVRAEATQADQAGKLMPVTIEPSKRPIMFELTHTAELSGWQGEMEDPRWVSFVGDVRSRIEGQEAATKIPVATHATGAAAPTRRGAAIALAVLTMALLAGTWFLLHERRADGQAEAEANTGVPVADKTLAVLPFVNLSSDKEQEYFADGLTEELLNSMARVRGLQVTGRTSSFYFKGKNEDLKVIGQKLGVENLLEGSVRKEGDQLRIKAQLIKAKDGFNLWSQTYDRPMKEIFKVQEEIARAVADALQITLGVGDLGQAKGLTRDVEAYQAYIEARALSNTASPEGHRRAMERTELAVQRDPSFLLAWLQLARAYRGNWLVAPPGEDIQWREKYEATIEEAKRVSRDPGFAKALDTLTLLPSGQWIELERNRKFIDAFYADFGVASLVPNPTPVDLHWVGVDKAKMGIQALEKARALDPLILQVPVNLAEAYANSGRMADAIAEQERGLAIDPHPVLMISSLFTARAMDDKAMLERNWSRVAVNEKDHQSLTYRMYLLRNRPPKALAELRRARAQGDVGAVHGDQAALWAGFFGDYEFALELLQSQRDPSRRFAITLSLWRPMMAGVRSLPGFKDLVRDLGLVDYWRELGWGEHCAPVGENDFQCH